VLVEMGLQVLGGACVSPARSQLSWGLAIAPTTHPATAIKLFDRALVLSSGDIFTLWCSALALSWLGDTETAIERAQRALQLSPFDPQKFLAYNALAIPYVQTQRYGEAHDAARRSVQLNHA
jgi:tetratricopeptide (TPR) repeat protein